MICEKTVIAIITARGGSKGVPRKNLRLVAGKPLISWTIRAAKASKYVDKVIVSSEDPEIIEVSKKFGAEVPFIRPKELSLDTTPSIEPLLHAVEAINEHFDYVVLLQPTSPFRSAEDIDNAIKISIEKSSSTCVSVVETDKSPFWMYYLNENEQLEPVLGEKTSATRRQDLPKTFALNGAVYVVETDFLCTYKTLLTEKTAAYVMPKERSLDIDTELDLMIADFLFKAGSQEFSSQAPTD